MSDEVLVERRGTVQVIIINRPEARNALNGAVAARIRDAADELDADDDLRGGVERGRRHVLLRDGPQGVPEGRVYLPSPVGGLCGITQTPPRKPLIGAAEGWALAAGFELLLACDWWWPASARFGVPEVKRWLVAGAGSAAAGAAGAASPRAGAAADRRSDRRPAGGRDRAGQPGRRGWPALEAVLELAMSSRPTDHWRSWPPRRSRTAAATGRPPNGGIRPPG